MRLISALDFLDFMLGRFDARLRFLLEGMYHPNIAADYERIHGAIGVRLIWERNLKDAAP